MTDRRRWVYFSPSWQELVEPEDRTPETSGGPAVDRTTQQFWGLRNVNDAILRRCDTNADGEWDGGDEEGGSGGGTYYQLTDSLFSVIAHVRSWSGDVLCRFSYDSYGKVKVHLPTDFNGDGLVNSWDLDAFTAAYASEAGGEGQGGTDSQAALRCATDRRTTPAFDTVPAQMACSSATATLDGRCA